MAFLYLMIRKLVPLVSKLLYFDSCTIILYFTTFIIYFIGIHNYIMFSVFTELRKVSLDVPNPVDEHANISGRSISTITVDPVTEDIFFSDINQHKITRWSRSTGETRVIPRLGSTKSEGLAVDWLSQQVYWSDIDSKTIEVSDYEGSVRSLLLTRDDGLSGPRAISLDLKNR